MKSEVGYDSFAEIYDFWVTARPVAKPNLDFYVDELFNASGLVVELGVGTGRIAVEVAKRGKAIVGVDASKPMLDRCALAAEKSGVRDRLDLVHGDFRSFPLPEKATLIAIPFHGIGHLLGLNDKAVCLKHIYSQLVPGGRLIFDHILFDLDSARRRQRIPQFRCEFTDSATGERGLLWAVDEYDFEKQHVRVRAWTDRIDGAGNLIHRRYFSLDYSWVMPEQFETSLRAAGFKDIVVYGDYLRNPLGKDSKEQVWVVSKPV